MTDTNTWQFDASTRRLQHESGLSLQIEGQLRDPEAVTPMQVPESLNSLQLVTLIREGTEYCRQLKATGSTQTKVDNTPSRPVLSLKKRKAS